METRTKEHVPPQKGSLARNDLLLVDFENYTGCVPQSLRTVDRDLRQGTVRAGVVECAQFYAGVYAWCLWIEVEGEDGLGEGLFEGLEESRLLGW